MSVTRVLSVHVTGPFGAPSPDQVQITCHIVVGLADGSGGVIDAINHQMPLTRSCKQGNQYRTPGQLNRAIMDDVKAHMLASYGIPIDGYDHEYMTGGYIVVH